jgi:WD40 repeat protein
MVTTGVDKTVRVWDVENQTAKYVYDGMNEQPSCIKWSPNGNLLCLNEKKGKMSVIDIRTDNGKDAMSTISHPGPKAQSNCFVSDNHIISVGFNKDATRKYCVWDLRYFSEALCRNDLGSGNSVQRLTYDHEHSLVHAFGRGSSEITLWKFNPDTPDGLLHLNNYIDSAPTIGFSLMPKHVCNVMKHEVNRGVRLTNDGVATIVSFTSENKTGLF